MNALASRVSTPMAMRVRAAAFSTSAPAKGSTSAGAGETAASAPSSAGWWAKLSQQTRRNIIFGVAACAVADSYVMYNYYPRWLGAPQEGKQ